MEISKTTLLKKLNLREKFPRELLHTRKMKLGIGLMKPSTILVVLSLQLDFDQMRMNNKTSKIIKIIAKIESMQYGY